MNSTDTYSTEICTMHRIRNTPRVYKKFEFILNVHFPHEIK